jgi:hypothetical protein
LLPACLFVKGRKTPISVEEEEVNIRVDVFFGMRRPDQHQCLCGSEIEPKAPDRVLHGRVRCHRSSGLLDTMTSGEKHG